jgi:hypothetical protein
LKSRFSNMSTGCGKSMELVPVLDPRGKKMDGFKYTHTITLPDGSAAEHTAEALALAESGDGGTVVLAACCGQVGGVLCDECNGMGYACCGHLGISPLLAFPIPGHATFYDGTDPAEEIKTHVQNVASGTQLGILPRYLGSSL